MTAPWPVAMRAQQLVLELRELLVRFDENLKAHTLLTECVPYFVDDAHHPAIAQARAEQAAMVDHIVGDTYATYYENNHHERPFEEQYQCSAEEAHERLHRVRFLRRWLEEQDDQLQLLDVACNDGWMAVNLNGAVRYTGVDLNPHCIRRAIGRGVPDARFFIGFAEDVLKELEGPPVFDVVVAYELVEHVRDPAKLLDVMVTCCKPGGSLFVSTPLGAGTGGDLPDWWFVEPKGHVRAYTPHTFAQLLSPHGHTEIEISDTQGAGQLMVARVDLASETAGIEGAGRVSPGHGAGSSMDSRDSQGDGTQPVRADRAGDQSDPRPARRSRAAKR